MFFKKRADEGILLFEGSPYYHPPSGIQAAKGLRVDALEFLEEIDLLAILWFSFAGVIS